MTLPQIWNALHEGAIPEPGKATFGSVAEAREWRREMLAKKEAAEARRKRAEVAKRRETRRRF